MDRTSLRCIHWIVMRFLRNTYVQFPLANLGICHLSINMFVTIRMSVLEWEISYSIFIQFLRNMSTRQTAVKVILICEATHFQFCDPILFELKEICNLNIYFSSPLAKKHYFYKKEHDCPMIQTYFICPMIYVQLNMNLPIRTTCLSFFFPS